MKDSIILFTMLALIIGVVIFGIWYIDQSNSQYTYEQTNNIVDKNDKPTTQSNAHTDPFGLFGANEVVYEIEVITPWSDETHVDLYPSTAHLSGPVLWTASRGGSVFSIGGMASDGIDDLAGEGRTRKIKQELEKLEEDGKISDFYIHERIDAPGKRKYQITVSRESPVVYMLSSLSPSPDWFVAVEGVSLLEDNRWKNQIEVAAIALDAGVREGNSFSRPTGQTLPPKPISALTDIPASKLSPFVYVRFKRIGYETE